MNTSPSKIVELRMHSPRTNRVLDRSWLDAEGDKVSFKVNADRFILPSNQHENAEKTIMFMGGSTTECSVVTEDKRFPNYVSKLFSSDGRSINTINLGKSGNTLHDTINIFFNDAHAFKPDILVVMHATNDGGVLEKDPYYRSRLAKTVDAKDMLKWFMQMFSTTQIGGLLRDAFANIATPAPKVKLIGEVTLSKNEDINYEAFEERLEIIVSMARSFKVRPVLMTQPLAFMKNNLTPEWSNFHRQKHLNEIIRYVANKNDVTLIDLSKHLESLPGFAVNPKNYLYDGMHVTDLGSEVYASHIHKVLSKIL